MRYHSGASSLFLTSVSHWINSVHGLPSEDCPILGPVFPKDFDLRTTKTFPEATSAFPSLIEEAFASGRVNESTSAFYIDVFSTVTNQSVYHYSHSASAYPDALTAGVLDEDTIFRVGSVSKLVTVYAILARTGSLAILDHPVTWYLPELLGNEDSDPLERIAWEDITVGALASQMAGTGSFPVSQLLCSLPDSNNCTVAGFLDTARNIKRPVTPPFGSSLYSDMGFGILGRVLESLTNMTYDEALQAVLGDPLNLSHVSSIEPEGEVVNAFVVPGDLSLSSWGFDNQISAPSGGVYSSGADLRKLGLAIMHSELLSQPETRKWMAPRAHTSDLVFSFGAPWEIDRVNLPVSPGSNRTRVSDLYTKAGGNAGYGSIFALSPDHGIGFSINVAGSGAASGRWALRDLVGQVFLPAAEHSAAENAATNLAGTFFGNESMPGTNITLSVDEDRPGLGMESLFLLGEESRGLLVNDLTISPNLSVRLYPTGLVSQPADNSTGYTERRGFRAVATLLPALPPVAALGGEGLFSNRCYGANLDRDFLTDPVSGYALDDFVFEVVDGRLERVQSVAAQVWFSRSKRALS